MLPDNTLKALSLVDELEDSKRQIAVLQASVNSLLPYKLFYNHIKAHLRKRYHDLPSEEFIEWVNLNHIDEWLNLFDACINIKSKLSEV
jgi:hypothetical protein